MNTVEEKILEILDYLLGEEDILACMVSRKGMEGIVPPMEKFKIKDLSVWELLDKIMDPFFDILEQFQDYNIDKVYFELGEYNVIFSTLVSGIALVCITPALSNRGLLEVEIKNAKNEIMDIITRKKTK